MVEENKAGEEKIGTDNDTGTVPPGPQEPQVSASGVTEEKIKCPYCELTFKDRRGLGPHLRFHKPKPANGTGTKGKDNTGAVNAGATDQIVNLLTGQIEQKLAAGFAEMEQKMSNTFAEALKLLSSNIDQKVNASAAALAEQAQTELQARLGIGGNGSGQAPLGAPMVAGSGQLNNLVSLLSLLRGSGGGGGEGGGLAGMVSQAKLFGSALTEILRPLSQIQSDTRIETLRTIDLVQKLGPGGAAKAIEDTMRQTATSPPGAPPGG